MDSKGVEYILEYEKIVHHDTMSHLRDSRDSVSSENVHPDERKVTPRGRHPSFLTMGGNAYASKNSALTLGPADKFNYWL